MKYNTHLLVRQRKLLISTAVYLLLCSCGEFESGLPAASQTRETRIAFVSEATKESSNVQIPRELLQSLSSMGTSGADTFNPTISSLDQSAVFQGPVYEKPLELISPASAEASKKDLTLASTQKATTSALSSGATSLIRPENIKLMGRFRIPLGGNGLESTTYSRGGMAMGEEGLQSSLYVVGAAGGNIAYGGNPNVHIGEIWVPESLSLSNDFKALPVATFKQPMTNALENKIGDVFDPSTPSSAKLEVDVRGVLKVGDKLLINAVMAYDNHNMSIAGHFSRPANLGVSGMVSGPVRVAPQVGLRHAPGPMFHVPESLQKQFSWPSVATGVNGLSINSTISNGPGTILFSPGDIETSMPRTSIAGVVLADYPYPNKTFAEAMGAKFGQETFDPLHQNPWWTPVSHTRGGGAWFEKFGTIVFSGFRGLGVPYYGLGTRPPSWAGADPSNPIGAPHAYPYQNTLLLIDQAEMIKSFKGEQAPHQVKAYSVIVLDDPFWPASQSYQICGSAHDRNTSRLYIRKCRSFDDGQSLVEVYQIN